MHDTENTELILDDFEDFLDGGVEWEDIDEEIGDIHLEAHAADDMDRCPSCNELYEIAEEAILRG